MVLTTRPALKGGVKVKWKKETTKFVLLFTFVAVILLLSSGLTGCGNGSGAAAGNISLRDAAIEKAGAWEKKRYEDILTQKDTSLLPTR